MIEGSGLGIAMKDSSPVVREVANLITEQSNNSNGVAGILRKILQ